jgi:DNA-binding GntR family transcriptional regulator
MARLSATSAHDVRRDATVVRLARVVASEAASGASFARISRRTLNDEVYVQLRERLMAGALAPGSTLTIRDLAASFGISPMPVREALRRLVAEHALVMLPNRSVAVPSLSRRQFEETTRIRTVLEGLAAEEATARIDDAAIALMERANARMVASRKGVDASYLEHNRTFHFTLYRASAMPTLVTMIESLWLQSGPLLTYAVTHAGYRATVVPLHHRQVLAGLAKRRKRAVRAAIVGDITDAARIVARHL